jgi:hypothetical protein
MTHEELEHIYFRLCSDHISIEAIPRTKMRIDFVRMKAHPPQEYELLMWTPHFVVLRTHEGVEITLRGDGRMIVRKSSSETVAHQIAAKMIELIRRDFAAY